MRTSYKLSFAFKRCPHCAAKHKAEHAAIRKEMERMHMLWRRAMPVTADELPPLIDRLEAFCAGLPYWFQARFEIIPAGHSGPRWRA